MKQPIVIHEVGPRDGLQIEKQIVPLEHKIAWIESLIQANIPIIQAGSFVHPQKVPQMADTDRLFHHFMHFDHKPRQTILSGLVLNERGLERALACDVELLCMGVSASNTHSRKNTGQDTAEANERILKMAQQALSAQKKVQVSVQSAFGCGYEGKIPIESVLKIVERYLEAGLYTISLADTAGHATPKQVEKLFEALFKLDPKVECACHFHDTYGLAMTNCYVALQTGVKLFESAFAGLGGCPFTAVTSGNVCTEDWVHMLQSMNYCQEINLEPLSTVAQKASQFFNRALPGRVHKIGTLFNNIFL